ncbi:GDSL-type esterase/lipase family protein [Kamptonema cortianum]|nr:GDSL-type esterase/lipase family protein [Geitlerinema splendidum]MDK3160970.1 GDSL-type esterase/lipase family protein [Kamptonema cortianum]
MNLPRTGVFCVGHNGGVSSADGKGGQTFWKWGILGLVILATMTFAFLGLQADPTQPADRLSHEWWAQRHAACVELTQKGGIDVIFLGDSITQGWESVGKATWDAEFAPLKAANFGFSGDRTEHVIWRLRNGEMAGLDAKVVVLMIGTNNIGNGGGDPAQTAKGVRAVVSELKMALPETKILLLAIFPRGENPDEQVRVKVAQATDMFKDVADGKQVHFLDIGKHFVRSTGTLRTHLMPDRLHLSPDGYQIWAKAMKPTLLELLEE